MNIIKSFNEFHQINEDHDVEFWAGVVAKLKEIGFEEAGQEYDTWKKEEENHIHEVEFTEEKITIKFGLFDDNCNVLHRCVFDCFDEDCAIKVLTAYVNCEKVDDSAVLSPVQKDDVNIRPSKGTAVPSDF